MAAIMCHSSRGVMMMTTRQLSSLRISGESDQSGVVVIFSMDLCVCVPVHLYSKDLRKGQWGIFYIFVFSLLSFFYY